MPHGSVRTQLHEHIRYIHRVQWVPHLARDGRRGMRSMVCDLNPGVECLVVTLGDAATSDDPAATPRPKRPCSASDRFSIRNKAISLPDLEAVHLQTAR